MKKEQALNLIKQDITKKENKIRNYGIDLLRIIAMISIIILHINLYSRILYLSSKDPRYKSAWRLETMGYWGVNGFGLISGIVGYKSYHFSNIMYIWVQSSFYSEIFTIYIYFTRKIKKKLFLSLFPILIRRHWYVNAYFFLYLFIPFINFGITHLNSKTYKYLVLFYFFIYSFYNIVAGSLLRGFDYHFLNYGYSTLWLLILYIAGGYFGKHLFQDNNHLTFKYIIFYSFIYLFSTFVSSEFKFSKIKKKFSIINRISLISYLSPTIVLQAISLIMIFSKLNIKNKCFIKIISFFTPLTFNVTLSHLRIFDERLFGINKLFKWVISLKAKEMLYKIPLIAFSIYIILALLDYVRYILFNILRIRRLCVYIEKQFPKSFDKSIN